MTSHFRKLSPLHIAILAALSILAACGLVAHADAAMILASGAALPASTLEAISAEFKALVQKFNEFRDSGEGDLAELKDKVLTLERKAAAGFEELTYGRGDPIGLLAKAMLADEGIRAVVERRAPKAGMKFKSADFFETKATIVNDLGGGSTLAQAQRIGLVNVGAPDVNSAILAAIPRGVATSSTVEWVKMTAAKSSTLAAPQYNSASPATREGAAKKATNLAFSLDKVDVVTLAHYTQVSRQALADTGALGGFIANELFDGVRRELIREVLAGDGVDGELEGLATSGNTTALPSAVSGEGRIERIRRSLGALQAKGFTPDAIVLHPNDWADIELQKSAGGSEEFLAGVPRGANPPTLWNTPVYPSEYQPEDTLTVGSFGESMQLFVRSEAELFVSDSHGDTFVQNVLTMLAEMRAALVVSRPAGILRGSF